MWLFLIPIFICLLLSFFVFLQPLLDKWGTINYRFFDVYCERLFSDEVEMKMMFPVCRIYGPKLEVSLVPNFYNIDALKCCTREQALGRTVIFIDTEPTPCSEVIKQTEPSVIISTKKEVLEQVARKRDTKQVGVYLPTFAEQVSHHRHDYSGLFTKKTYSRRPTDFCVFAYSNCNEKWSGVRHRKDFYQRLQKKSGQRVTNFGKCYSERTSKKFGDTGSNNETFRNFKFVISFENELSRGYISEKLINAMLAGVVPIYLGAPDVCEYFNPLSFVDVRSFADFDSCIDYVISLDANDEAYDEMRLQPWMTQEQVQRTWNLFAFPERQPFHAKLFRELLDKGNFGLVDCMRLNSVLDRGATFLTFADGQVFTSDRVLETARRSNYFTNFVAMDPSLPFLQAHRAFVEKNRRGLGYWIWKPASIFHTLSELPEGDILVYSDSGSEVLPFYASTVYRWYDMLIRGGKEILVLELPFAEHEWTKMDVIKAFLPGATAGNVEALLASSALGSIGQIGATALVMKNSGAVRRIVKDWMDLAVGDSYSLIDDSVSVAPNHSNFREHRHDQSLLSLLLKFKFPAEKIQILEDLKYSHGKKIDQPLWFAHKDKSGSQHGRYW
jgi:Glycosyltransferase family 10 (fucosyltransferase) C-term